MSAPPGVEDLRRYYDEHLEQARQHEQLRSQATSTLSAIAAGVVGLAGIDGLSRSDIPAGILVVAVAVLGVAISLKHYERYKFHALVLDHVRAEVERSVTSNTEPRSARLLWAEAEALHSRSWTLRNELRSQTSQAPGTRDQAPSLIARTRLHLLWALVPASIGLVGMLMVVLAAAI